MFNSKFHLIKTINKISNESFNITDFTTNSLDRIFFTNYNDNIIYSCDFEFNLIKKFKAPIGNNYDEFYGPYGIAYSNQLLYVVDSSNKRIKKMNSVTFDVEEIFPLDYQAFEISCFGVDNEILCVKSDASFIYSTDTRLFVQNFSYYLYNLKKKISNDFKIYTWSRPNNDAI